MQPPRPDEVEISLFGPGYGECIVIHTGDNQWIVVDSCINSQYKKPAALHYLSLIGVNPAVSVKLIVASHWHDDHVRGLGRMYRECHAAGFVCSEALGSQDFFDVVYAQGYRLMSTGVSGLDEFREVFDELERRAQASGERLQPPHFAVAERCLWRQTVSGANVNCEVHSLSPSDASLMASKLEIARFLQKPKEPKRGIWPSGKNHTAVALWVSVGDRVALLGADLEETDNKHTGWEAIVQAPSRPRGKASVFKVPHHGSETGHNDKVWIDMLEKSPVAILTPYGRGGLLLPQKSDVKRICQLTNKIFITAPSSTKKRIQKRDSAVEKTLKDLGLEPRLVNNSIGHIRLRAKQGQDWNVKLFDQASEVKCV